MHTNIEPAAPLVPWMGGKRRLSKRICALIDAFPHRFYAEPFVGQGGVFLRRQRRPRAELINDANSELITMFRVLQRHQLALAETLRWTLYARAEFNRLLRTPAEVLTDVERAARFIVVQALGFGGKTIGAGVTFGVSLSDRSRGHADRLIARLPALHRRLQGVVIEHLDFEAFIRRYDRPDGLFYLDPPYFGSEKVYGLPWSASDWGRLEAALRALKGTFLLSINACDEAQKRFGHWPRAEVPLTYSVNPKTKPAPAIEWLISNRSGLLSGPSADVS